jgi:hypothetical protein
MMINGNLKLKRSMNQADSYDEGVGKLTFLD